MKSLVSVALVATLGSGETVNQKLPSSCADLSNGVHYVQPLSPVQMQKMTSDDSRTAPPVKVQCSDGYTIINPNLDSNIENYFSSFHPYHKAFAGPDLDDHVTWKRWFLPSRIDNDMIFTPATDDCSSCESLDDYDYPGETAYYMTGDLIGCNWPTKNLCGFDFDTLECSMCSPATFTATNDDSEMWGTCGQMPYKVSFPVSDSHSGCTEGINTVLPSIGRTGHACVCYKPSKSVYNHAAELIVDTSESELSTEQDFYQDASHLVKLSNEDFKYGTYRIRTAGTYQLTEDIVFDFNAPEDLDEPNAFDAWFPKSEQSEEYPGAGELDGWYWLGFYAGITVESDDVTIDLNGFSIQMSDAFYLQQRWFVGILLANKPFIDTQGPTWTGTDIDSPSRVTIKDGTIGLSSHHGILGSRVEDVVISNVVIKDFETHGVAFNEFTGLTLENVEIGPSSTKAYVSGRYSLARMELPILRAAAEEFGEETVVLPTRGEITFNDLLDKLVHQLDMVFSYVYEGVEQSGDEWEEAYKTFIVPSGIPSGGAVYGAIFRPRGASVMNFNKYDSSGYSTGLTLKNVEIHDLAIETEEIPTFGTNKEMWVRDSINAPVPFVIATVNNLESVPEMVYEGNIWTDVVIALKKHATSWWHLGRMSMSDLVVEWAENGDEWQDHEDTDTIHCNMDSLGHLVKGVLGMKIEYVQDAVFANVKISNIVAMSDLGTDICGEYHDGNDGGHALQSKVTNEGWGGSNSYGIWFSSAKNFEIDDLEMSELISYNGRVFGLRAYKSQVQIHAKSAQFSNFIAGAMLDEHTGYNDAWPNAKASTCAVEDDHVVAEEEDVSVSCMAGRGTCTCALVSCLGAIESECDGFEAETPAHVIKVAQDGTMQVTEKNVEMNIGLRDAQYIKSLDNLKKRKLLSLEESESEQQEEGAIGEEEVEVVKNGKENDVWMEFWRSYWIFVVLGMLAMLCGLYGLYRACRKHRRGEGILLSKARESINNTTINNNISDHSGMYTRGLVSVDSDDEDLF